MFPNLPYQGFTWQITQHTGIVCADTIVGLLRGCAHLDGQPIDIPAIDAKLSELGRFSSETGRSLWRDYQQVLSEFGFIVSAASNDGVLKLTPVSKELLAGRMSFGEAMTLQLLRYQYPNGFKRTMPKNVILNDGGDVSSFATLTDLQESCGVRIRPFACTWEVLDGLSQKLRKQVSLSVDEMARFVFRCSSHADVERCCDAIIACRKGDKSIADQENNVKRNAADWVKLLSMTSVFSLKTEGRKTSIAFSEQAIVHADALRWLFDKFNSPELFWQNHSVEDWFSFYGKLDPSLIGLLCDSQYRLGWLMPSFIGGMKMGSNITSKIKGVNFSRSDLLAAIRAKPFILLAGMSGTGKTRIVRQLARGCCPAGNDLAKDPDHPGNYECIPVRPNWHDSTGLMGYVSRIDGAKYVVTDFVRFLAKAWLHEDKGIPFFLCLDEMNLAPVEQYFAEYLSVVESRRVKDGKIVTDPLVRVADEKLLKGLLNEVYPNKAGEVANLVKMFVEQGGIPIPSNFVVMGTVNMDETTCSFPRKVLDRAMTFELNEFDVDSGLDGNPDIPLGSISLDNAKGGFTHGWQVYAEAKETCEKIKPYLGAVNGVLDGTRFKFAYRTRDEVMAYCVERMKDGTALAVALDEATSMKVLSRIEGDEQIVKRAWLEKLQTVIVDGLKALVADGTESPKKCADKLDEMRKRLVDTGFTSFWT